MFLAAALRQRRVVEVVVQAIETPPVMHLYLDTCWILDIVCDTCNTCMRDGVTIHE